MADKRSSVDLPLFEWSGNGEDSSRRGSRAPKATLLTQISRRRKWIIIFALAVFVGVFVLRPRLSYRASDEDFYSWPHDDHAPPPPGPPGHHVQPPGHHAEPPPDYAMIARMRVNALFARQSKTLRQARARYSLKNNRPPPPGYNMFFDFAQQNGCMIDEYDKVHRDFEPFYQIAKNHPNYFPDMLEKAMELAKKDWSLCLTPFYVTNHKAVRGENDWSPFAGDWERLMNDIAPMLPNMVVVFNYQDEPRVLFNARRPDAYEYALKKSDSNPFHQGPRPTKQYYEEASQHQCLLPNSDRGFGNLTNDVNAFILSSTSTQHTLDLYPILSPARLSSCFADIVIPSSYYYDRSGFAARYSFPDNVNWADKKSIIYWRGSSSGGALDGQNYHSFPRFRIVDMSLKRPDMIDAAITRLHNCNPTPGNPTGAVCLDEEIKSKYEVNTPGQPREEVYKYKYLLDIDGNSFSGRYFGLLRSGSLVFKSTTISEFFDDWLIPYEHFIPVFPDLSDLEEKIQWARDNDEEARQIQMNGLEFARRVLTDSQLDCYHMNVFLEHGRLQQRPT